MKNIHSINIATPTITSVPNEFIDHGMQTASADQIRVYLMILRLTAAGIDFEVAHLASRLSMTENRVRESLTWLKNAGLVDYEAEQNPVTDSAGKMVPVKPGRSAIDVSNTANAEDFSQAVFMTEMYFGRPLNFTELNSMCYIHKDLGFSVDLMEYLIEYCVEKNKKSFRYIETVAVNWFREGIDSLEAAKEATRSYTENVFAIMKALGISGRQAAPVEVDYIKKWNAYGMEQEVLLEACNRSLLKTHEPSFHYVDGILSNWNRQGVKTMQDIRVVDEMFKTNREEKQDRNVRLAPSTTSTGGFNNFEQRDYDYRELESVLLGRRN